MRSQSVRRKCEGGGMRVREEDVRRRVRERM